MTSDWYVRIGGVERGPISSEALKHLAIEGKVRAETSIKKGAAGNWVPASRVTGLFAPPAGSAVQRSVPAFVSPSAPSVQTTPKPQVVATAPGAAGIPSPKDAAKKDHLVRNVGIAAVVITALLVAVLVTPELMHDKWELHNTDRVSAKLEEAGRLQQSDPLSAYKIYDEVLKEAQQHKITDEQFSKKLADAEKSRTALYQKVQPQILAAEAEKQRLVQEESRRAAAEKQRVAEEEERKRATEEAQRIAEAKRLAEEKRRKEAVSVYRNAPPSARTALNALKKLEARTEVGINYGDYSTAVGDAWGDVKIFIESPDGKSLPEFSALLSKAVKHYKLARDIWDDKIQFPTLYGGRTDVEVVLQPCWLQAGERIKLAESLLDVEKTEKTLEAVGGLLGNEEDLDAAWTKVEEKVHREVHGQ